jgi:pimeloyl-ACP methyl ester carboxylesterase
MPRVKVNGWKFLYRQAGTGLDVVMLPGAASLPSSRHLFDTLATEFRVTVYESRDATSNGQKSADMADDVRGLHEALDLRPAYLVAHGEAALAALHTAVLYPDLVAGILLTEPSLPDVPTVSSRSARSGLTTRRILLIERPVVVLCGPQTSSLALCRFLQEHLPCCEALLVSEDPSALVTTIYNRLREMAGLARPTNGPPSGHAPPTGPRGIWPRLREAGDGHAVARWMTRLSAWGL